MLKEYMFWVGLVIGMSLALILLTGCGSINTKSVPKSSYQLSPVELDCLILVKNNAKVIPPDCIPVLRKLNDVL